MICLNLNTPIKSSAPQKIKNFKKRFSLLFRQNMIKLDYHIYAYFMYEKMERGFGNGIN